MRRVYLSFLGLGQYNRETGKYSYRKTVYALGHKLAPETCFVQVAEQELLGWNYFDRLFIAATLESYKVHGTTLKEQLSPCRGEISFVVLDEDMSEHGQWKWFEEIFQVIEDNDILTVDLTHGYRSIPVIFSTAINFLQKTKKVSIEHVFYGAYEKDKERAPLVDMRSFYDINTWADAVGRLTDDADASGIAMAASSTSKNQFANLSDPDFVQACRNITRLIKNVDINNVPGAVNKLMEETEKISSSDSASEKQLMAMLQQKFRKLASASKDNPDRGGYTLEHYKVQLELADLLLEHGFLMQGFTVMREWLASLVMLYFEATDKMNASKRRKRIQHYGDIFFNMLQFREDKWKFEGKEEQRDRVLPFYNQLKEGKVIEPLLSGDKPLAERLSKIRNGLDHAWLGRPGMSDDLEEQGRIFLEVLKTVMKNLEGFKLT